MLDLYPCRFFPDRDRDLVQEGQDQKSNGPDADRDHGLRIGWPVGVYLLKGIRHETTYDQSETFVYPEGDKENDACKRQHSLVLPDTWDPKHEERNRRKDR